MSFEEEEFEPQSFRSNNVVLPLKKLKNDVLLQLYYNVTMTQKEVVFAMLP